MALTTVNITGTFNFPDATWSQYAKAEFHISGFDTDTEVVIPKAITSTLGATGALDVDIWGNDDGIRGTVYRVYVVVYEGASYARELIRRDLGLIQINGNGPFDIANLLNTPAIVPEAWYRTITQAEYDAAIDAVAAAEAARDATIAAAATTFNTDAAFIAADLTAYPDGTIVRAEDALHIKVTGALATSAASIKNDWEYVAFPNIAAMEASVQPVRGTGSVWDAGKLFMEVSSGTADMDEAGGVDGYHRITAGGVKLQFIPDVEVDVTAMGDRGTDDVALMIRRAAIAFPGKVLRVPAGTYNARTVAQIGDQSSCHILADGADITQTQPLAFIRSAAPTWEAIQTISAVSGDDYWGNRASITVTDGSAYSVGDLIKVVSDDKQRCTRATPVDGTDYRTGWMAFVSSISTNVLTIDNPCPFDLTTNPRIGRMPRRFHSWKGGRVGYAAGVTSDPQPNPFAFYGVSDLNIEVDIARAPSAAISIIGCFKPRVKVKGDHLDNDPGAGKFGYLINDGGSYFADADTNSGRNRHGYTTNQSLVSSLSTSLELFGGTYGAYVKVLSHGNSQAGADTHHGSEKVTFDVPVCTGGQDGGGGIVFRGIDHVAIAPQISNGKYGILCYNEDGVVNGNSSATVINGNIDVDQEPFQVLNGGELTLIGGEFRSRKYGEMATVDGLLTLEGPVTFRPGGTTAVNSSRAINLTDSTVDARQADVLFDLQDIPDAATDFGCVQGGGATLNKWISGTVRTINDTGLTAIFYKLTGSAASNEFSPELMVTQKYGSGDLTNASITGSAGVGLVGGWRWTAEDKQRRSDYIQVTLSADYVIPLLNRGDPVVKARLFASVNRTLGAIPAGAVMGQTLMMSFTASTGVEITVPHGASFNTSLPGGVDLVRTAETGLTLVWNGSRWAPGA